MASGRLGSAVVPANRTAQIYSNTSGGAVSLSLMAQAKSTTANVPLSIKIDSGSTAAETTTQIDSSSYTDQTVKLLYNSAVTSVIGDLEYDDYGTGSTNNVQMTLNTPSGTGNAGTDDNHWTMPMCTTSDFTSWKGFEDNVYFPIRAGNVARWATPAEAATSGDFNFVAQQLNKNWSPAISTSKALSIDYYNQGVVADPYCKRLPFFCDGSSWDMQLIYLQTNNSTTKNNRSTNSVFYFINSSNYNTGSNGSNPYIFMNGGMGCFVHYYDATVILRYYGKDPSNTVMGQVIENNVGSAGSSYPLDFWFEQNTSPSSGYPMVVWHQYNPYTNKIYTLMNMGQSSINRKLVEWDCDALDTALSTMHSSGTQKYASGDGSVRITNNYDIIFTDGLAVDRTDNLPAVMKVNTTTAIAPMKRVKDKEWIVGVRDPYASPSSSQFWKTSDFLTWTQVEGNEYYSEKYSTNVTVQSNGTVTNALASNFDSISDAGLLEYQTSVNNYERTGLVLSNNDKVYVRNHGDVDLSISAMGYEE